MAEEQPLPPIEASTQLKGAPWVPVEGIFNFRDLGGHAVYSEPSTSVKTSFIYRCAEPSRVTAQGREVVKQLEIKKFFDLRSEPELNKPGRVTPLVAFEIAKRVFIPVFKTEDYSPEKIAVRYQAYASGSVEASAPSTSSYTSFITSLGISSLEQGFVQAYRDILNAGIIAYRTIFEHIRDEPGVPVVIHCTAGKDRTGVICALILKLAGVHDDVISREYELTTQGLAPMRPIIMGHLKADEALKDNPQAAENMISSRKEAMLAFLKVVDSEYGGVENYMSKNLEFSREDIAKIKSNLVHNKAPSVVLED